MRPPDSKTVLWPEAAAVLREHIDRASRSSADQRPVIVGITGPVGSGKTTLARALGGVLLSTDHYLPDYDSLPETERDEPRHADLKLLGRHLDALRRRERIQRPEWCFQTHRRIGTEPVEPGPMVVCEGIFALHEAVRTRLDVAVYVDAPAGVRWARWERIEAAGERGWGVERARAYFSTVAEPTFQRFAAGYWATADVVILNSDEKGARA